MGVHVGIQELTVLSHIKQHGSITALQAVELGIYRLSARVYNLRKLGHEIVTHTLEIPNRYGTTSKFARYTLRNV